MFALFDNIGGFELMIVAVAALLVFGKRLPEVASQAASTLAKFKRSLNGAIDESGVQDEIRKLKNVLPRDMSMAEVARLATRKMEERLLEKQESEQEVAIDALAPIDPASLEEPGHDEMDPHPPAAVPPPTHTPGVDPAKNFGPPGSVPRD